MIKYCLALLALNCFTSLEIVVSAGTLEDHSERGSQVAKDANRTDDPPNIIFIMADDLGYGDLGCYGQKSIKTPRIDQLAKQGMRFTNFYAGSTVCAPSRCALMTGLHTGNCYIRGNKRINLRYDDITIPEILSDASYISGLCGKWGLGQEGSEGIPTEQGFEYFYGYLNQRHAHNYYPTFLYENEERVALSNIVPDEGEFGEGKASEKVQYSHTLIVDKALEFIEEYQDDPFFLYVALTIPHANNEAKNEGMEVPDFGEYADKEWSDPQKGHAAMISLMDADVGRIVDLLDELALRENTIVFFTSDNGPHREGGYRPEMNMSNGPLREYKRSLHEGGIRVPMIANWPGKVPAGSVSDHVAAFWDVMPTLASLAGDLVEVPEDIDGITFHHELLGDSHRQTKHKHLYWAFFENGGGRALREGKWKLIQQPYHSEPRLYDLERDLGEIRDVSKKHPTIVRRLVQVMDQEFRPSDHWRFLTKDEWIQQQKSKADIKRDIK